MVIPRICTNRGFRSEVLKRAFAKLDAMERQGRPAFNPFGQALREAFAEVRREAEKLLKRGACGERE